MYLKPFTKLQHDISNNIKLLSDFSERPLFFIQSKLRNLTHKGKYNKYIKETRKSQLIYGKIDLTTYMLLLIQ